MCPRLRPSGPGTGPAGPVASHTGSKMQYCNMVYLCLAPSIVHGKPAGERLTDVLGTLLPDRASVCRSNCPTCLRHRHLDNQQSLLETGKQPFPESNMLLTCAEALIANKYPKRALTLNRTFRKCATRRCPTYRSSGCALDPERQERSSSGAPALFTCACRATALTSCSPCSAAACTPCALERERSCAHLFLGAREHWHL